MWEYESGGGFDWYESRTTATEAFEVEKKNCDELSTSEWKCVLVEYPVLDGKMGDEITDAINDDFCNLFDSASVRYP